MPETLNSTERIFALYIASSDKLDYREKELLIIAGTIAEYSKELWQQYYPDKRFSLWKFAAADAGGAVIGILATLNPAGVVASAVFFSMFYMVGAQ